MYLSGRDIHVVQILDARGTLHRWNYNSTWFETHAGTGEVLSPNFVLPIRLSASNLRTLYSEPDRIVECAGQAVWIYDHPIYKPAQANGFELEAALLPYQVGVTREKSRIAVANEHAAGFLTFGPYKSINIGEYSGQIRYRSISDHSWDMVAGGAVVKLLSGSLPSTDGEWRIFEFDLTVENRLDNVEIRTNFSGSGELEVEYIGLRKL